MNGDRGAALLIEWMDVDPSHEAKLTGWYAHEELPRLVSVPGVLGAAFYEATEGAPRHMVVCELDDARVLGTEAWVAGLQARRASASAAAIAPALRRHLRIGYHQVFPRVNDLGAPPAPAMSYLQVGRMDIQPEREQEFNDWYDTAYIPPYQAIEGCLDARRFLAVDGQPRYLTLYGLANPQVRHSAQWQAAKTSNPWTLRFQPLQHGWGSPGVYRRIVGG